MKQLLKNINHAAYRFCWKYAPYIHPKVPVCVDLELSSVCNLRCGFCYHANEKTPFRKAVMSQELASHALLQAHKIGVPSVKFNYRGEPTMNPRFYEITSLAKELAGAYTFQDRIVNTNANFGFDYSDKVLDGILNCTTIKISVDSFVPEVYSRIRKGGNHAKMLNVIDQIVQRKTDQRVVLQFVRSELNRHEDIKTLAVAYYGDAVEISVREEVKGRSGNASGPLKETKACHQPYARMLVLYDGRLTMCCNNYMEAQCMMVGHLYQEGIFRAFNSDKAKRFRKMLVSGQAFQMEPCRSCDSRERYTTFAPNKES